MNMFQFAVASIVDVNTGNGLLHGGSQARTGESLAGTRYPAGKGFTDRFHAVGRRIVAWLESYRQKASLRRDIQALLHMSDRQLDDIGLHRADLEAVAAGFMTLAELEAEREQRRGGLGHNLAAATLTRPAARLEASNDRYFAAAECA